MPSRASSRSRRASPSRTRPVSRSLSPPSIPRVADLILERLPDVSRFEGCAAEFLGAREAENNLVLGLITGLKGGRTFGPLPPYFTIVRRAGAAVAAAMRTPPHNLILTDG